MAIFHSYVSLPEGTPRLVLDRHCPIFLKLLQSCHDARMENWAHRTFRRQRFQRVRNLTDSGAQLAKTTTCFPMIMNISYIIYINISWNNLPYSNYIPFDLIQLLDYFSLSETPSCDTSMASIGGLHGAKQEHGTTNYRLYTKKKHDALQICQFGCMNLLQHSFEWTLEGFHKWGYP